MNKEQLLADIDTTLQHIAREASGDNSRIEYDDMLQEARVGAWQGLLKGEHIPPQDLRRYAIACGRNQVRAAVKAIKKDFLYHCDNYGLTSDLPDNVITI